MQEIDHEQLASWCFSSDCYDSNRFAVANLNIDLLWSNEFDLLDLLDPGMEFECSHQPLMEFAWIVE